MEMAMSALMVTCPITGKAVTTGIETEADVLRVLPRVEAAIVCPACGEKHFWTRSEAYLEDQLSRHAA
jgi:endogenous inhibitor of DNA gyrase (YacG/DUF329 family)